MPTSSSSRPVIQIISDGDPAHTEILAPDGSPMPNVTEFILVGEANEMVRATIMVMMPKADVNAELHQTTFVCPCCQDRFEHRCRPGGIAYE